MNLCEKGLNYLARNLLRDFGAKYKSDQLVPQSVGRALHTLTGCVLDRAEAVSQPRGYFDLRQRQGSAAGAL